MQFMGHKDIGKGADFDFGWAGNEVIRRQINGGNTFVAGCGHLNVANDPCYVRVVRVTCS